MIQGWNNSNYLYLIESQTESLNLANKYKINGILSEYQFYGILNWDEFILKDGSSQYFKIPTVPFVANFLKPIPDFEPNVNLSPDPKLFNLIRWHVKPVVFGGDPVSETNISWVDFDQHIDLVIWWNEQYRHHKNINSSPNFTENQLHHSAYFLADEIRAGKHVQPNWFKSLFSSNPNIQILKNRCPGYTDEEYRIALGKAMFETR